MLNVKVDVSENTRFKGKLSIIGVAAEDGNYKKNRALCVKDVRKGKIKRGQELSLSTMNKELEKFKK